MNASKPPRCWRAVLAMACGALGCWQARAQGIATEPVGYSALPLLANSETIVAMPFQRPAEYLGSVAQVAGPTLTIAGAPNWTVNRFAYSAGAQPNTYYVFLRSGAREGHWFTVLANGADTLTVDPGSDSLAGVVAGDTLKLVPHWTLGTLFPASGAGLAFTATSNAAAPQTTILLPDPQAAGINPAPAAGFVFSSGAWRQIGGDPAVSRNDEIIRPGTNFRVRNAADGGALVMAGSVVFGKQALTLATNTGSEQDNPVALLRPLPVTLNDAGLVSSGAFAASSNALVRSDLLLVFDNTVAQLNKPANAFYFFYNGGWRKLGQPLNQDFGAEAVFDLARGVVIRKAPTANGAPQTWTNLPKY